MIKRRPTTIGFALLLCALAAIACNDPVEDALQGQANLPITFYGLAVDQSGQPLPGASFEVLVDAIPKDWTFAKRGEPHVKTRHNVVSGPDGRFQLDVVAHLIFVENVRAKGYRHLYLLYGPKGNTGYQITSWSQQMYKSDPDRPAVYVFARDGVKEVSVLPSRGGYDAPRSGWRANEPKWPRTPSLKDVVYVPPATQPGTQPDARPAE